MDQRTILITIIRLLNRRHISYLVTGSLAVSYYGFPRATHDIDFIIEVSNKNTQKIVDAFLGLNKFFLVDAEAIQNAVHQLRQFNLFHTKSGVKIDFWVLNDTEFEQSKFKRRKRITIDGTPVSIVSAEDLILTKLAWCKIVYSDRHIRDCIGIWKIQKQNLDKKYLNLWANRLEVEDFLKEIKEAKAIY